MPSLRSACCILLVTALHLGFTPQTWATDDTEETVKVAVEKFYTALNQVFAGKLDNMESLCSHKDDVTYHGPTGGIKHGWNAVRKDWVKQANLKLGGNVNPQQVSFIIGRDIAIVSNYEIGKNIGRDRKPLQIAIRATSTFRKEDGKWKMIGHHADPLPYLSKTH